MAPLLIFDCDGVLVDSEPLAAQCFADHLADLGLQATPGDIDAAFRGRRLQDCLPRVAEWLGRPLPEDFVESLHRRTFAAFRERLQPVAGVRDALAALGDRPRCVASSGEPEKIALSLAITGLARCFGDACFSAEAVARGKPAPDLFLHAAERMGFAPGDCVVVEDSDPGIAAGLAAGMRTLAYRPAGPVPAGAEPLRRMDALPALLVAPRGGSGLGGPADC